MKGLQGFLGFGSFHVRRSCVVDLREHGLNFQCQVIDGLVEGYLFLFSAWLGRGITTVDADTEYSDGGCNLSIVRCTVDCELWVLEMLCNDDEID